MQLSQLGFACALCCGQDFSNLRWIYRRRNCAVDDLQFSPSGLVRDRGYFSLNNFAAVEADADAGAYTVIHILSILPSIDSVMVVTWETRERSKRRRRAAKSRPKETLW